MADEPTVSILMGVYNEEEYLKEAIDSILRQTFTNFEFIIVDDNSDDDSTQIIQSYEDDRIQFLQNSTNNGLTTSLNRALDHATGKYIARQDADDISKPNRLQKQVEFLEQYDEIALLGTGTYLIDSTGKTIDHRIGYCNPTFDNFLEKSHLVHGSILARRAVLEVVDGYDEFFRYGQDLDLWLRITEQYSVSNIPDPLYYHRIHNEGVYFSHKDQSALYGIFARHLATGKVGSKVKDELNENKIHKYYNYLNLTERKRFHQNLATRYLRYGHTKQALEECQNARNHGRTTLKTLLLSLLAYGGQKPTHTVRWGLRRYLNWKTKIINQMLCFTSADQ